MYILGFMTLVSKLLRSIFYSIDDVIYRQIPRLYDLILAIARTSPLSQATIADMASRIYKLLAVFMIFKVTFSLIMYIVNPDDFSDKSKGVSKLITNIVISLGLLILTPYIFSYAFQFQKIVLDDNSVATLIFGDDLSSEDNVLNNAGNTMAYALASPFITPNYNYFNCTTLKSGRGTEAVLNEKCFGFNTPEEFVDGGRCDVARDEFNTLCSVEALGKDNVANYAAATLYSNYNFLFRKGIATTMYNDDDFAFDYHWLISTIVGAVAVLFLITTCMDIGIRSIKLGFLQLIAPIPILSYIDPKGGKDGMFKKWYQLCLKTFLSLFLKLFAVYFAIYIIGRVGDIVDIVDGSYITNGYVRIFIIIGALMFAKNFTKMLESLGVKLDGGFQLNPLKKIEDEALFGKQASKLTRDTAKLGKKAVVGTATGLGVGAAATMAGLVTGKGVHRATVKSAFASGFKGDKLGKTFATSYGAAKSRHTQLQEMKADGVSRWDIFKDNTRTAFGMESKATKVKRLEDYGKAIQSSYDTIKNQAVACDKTDVTVQYTYVDPNTGVTMTRGIDKSAKTISKELDELKKTTIDRESFRSTAVSNLGTGATATAIEAEINRLYGDAITAQKNRVNAMEGELEARINAVVQQLFNDPKFSTGSTSADNVIKQETEKLKKLRDVTNKLGTSLDDNYGEIDVPDKDDAGANITNVVNIMKQGKGTVAQAGSGKMEHYADVSKYTDKNKK